MAHIFSNTPIEVFFSELLVPHMSPVGSVYMEICWKHYLPFKRCLALTPEPISADWFTLNFLMEKCVVFFTQSSNLSTAQLCLKRIQTFDH